MIPSRPLALVEIVTETFTIYWRTFARYGILFLLLVVPGICIITAGSTGLAEDAIVAARHDINFSDSDLTIVRNDFNAFVTQQNPVLAEKLPGAGQAYPHATTRELYHYFVSNLSRFASPIDLIALGFLLLILGVFALVAITVDLASQVFEERPQELFGSLRAAFAKHVWKILLLYLLYMIAVLVLDGVLDLLPDAGAGVLSGFVLVAQVYFILRLFVTIPALVSEESGPFQAIRRSWELTNAAVGRILGSSIVFSVILFVGLMIVGVFMQLLFSNFAVWWNEFLTRDRLTLQWLLESTPRALWAAAAEMSVSLLVVFGVLPIFGTVLYYDLRTRRDGPLVYVDEHA